MARVGISFMWLCVIAQPLLLLHFCLPVEAAGNAHFYHYLGIFMGFTPLTLLVLDVFTAYICSWSLLSKKAPSWFWVASPYLLPAGVMFCFYWLSHKTLLLGKNYVFWLGGKQTGA